MIDFFEKLTLEIKRHDRIILMTHQIPDLDGLGSAIALSEIVKSFGKECCIVAPKNLINKTLNKALKYLSDCGVVIPFKYEESFKYGNDLLIVLDVQEEKLTECGKLISIIKDRCVIDHHSSGLTVIDDNVCEYLDDSMSSTVQIICSYMQYLGIEIDYEYNTVLLAGLYQDTNYFTLKTTSETFDTASYLLNSGADIMLSHYFLKESMRSAIKKYEDIKKVRKIDNNVYISIVDDRKCTNITVAKIADELLKFDDVNLAFAIGEKRNGDVVISGRSCDNIDVCSMMKQLGGGGHFGAAAALVHDGTIDDVYEKLIQIVRGR